MCELKSQFYASYLLSKTRYIVFKSQLYLWLVLDSQFYCTQKQVLRAWSISKSWLYALDTLKQTNKKSRFCVAGLGSKAGSTLLNWFQSIFSLSDPPFRAQPTLPSPCWAQLTRLTSRSCFLWWLTLLRVTWFGRRHLRSWLLLTFSSVRLLYRRWLWRQTHEHLYRADI